MQLTWPVAASVLDTPIAVAGGIAVSAIAGEVVNATVANTSVAATQGVAYTATAGAGAVLASNKISSAASMLAGASGSVPVVWSAPGATVGLVARDSSGIYSNVKLVASATTANDGGIHTLARVLDQIGTATYASTDGVRGLVYGDTVRLADGGIVSWMGPRFTTWRDLRTERYTDRGYWKPVGATSSAPSVNITPSVAASVAKASSSER